LPALLSIYVRSYVREPEVWVENRRRQHERKQETRAPLVAIFNPVLLRTTLTACWLTASSMIVYFSMNGLAATWLQREFHPTAAFVATPIL
jgi:SHS family lactate transporter-like MFS transporter